MKVKTIIDFMEMVAPCEVALDFDNVGLLVGRCENDVTKILTALDCSLDVVKEAAKIGAQMIVCHHPIMFSPVQKITDETPQGRMLLAAIEEKISIFAAHTNLDFAQGGLNDYFLKRIGFEPKGDIEEGEGRIFDVGTISAKELCEKIKTALGLKLIRTSMEEERILHTGALCTGGGKSLAKSAAQKADFYISGDLGHHDILDLYEAGCGFIEVSHFDSEKIAMDLLYERLTEHFGGEIEIVKSQANKNPMSTII